MNVMAGGIGAGPRWSISNRWPLFRIICRGVPPIMAEHGGPAPSI
jgi:hypothetical protein